MIPASKPFWLALCLLIGLATAIAADSPQFRGPNRDGIYPEKGLLKTWPDGGPTLNWEVTDLGPGHASVTVVGNHIYTTGVEDLVGYLYAYDTSGKQLWKSEYGPAHNGGGYPGSRTTPTYDNGDLYVMSTRGGAACFDASSGKKKWFVDTLARFGGSKSPDELIPRWAISESVLIDGNNVICMPGAPDAAVVALNKKDGSTVWTTKGLSDLSGYGCARVFDNGKIRQVIALTAASMVGLHPSSGAILWKEDYPVDYGIHANLPTFFNDHIFISDGYGQGSRMYQIGGDGKSVSKVWELEELDIHHGNAVLIDGKIYGASNRRKWYRVDAATGKVEATGKGVGKGVVVYADGLLYGYGERGHVAIIDPKSDDLAPISVFRISQGSGQHWAHPVIAGGNLYVRRGNALMSYSIKAN